MRVISDYVNIIKELIHFCDLDHQREGILKKKIFIYKYFLSTYLITLNATPIPIIEYRLMHKNVKNESINVEPRVTICFMKFKWNKLTKASILIRYAFMRPLLYIIARATTLNNVQGLFISASKGMDNNFSFLQTLVSCYHRTCELYPLVTPSRG